MTVMRPSSSISIVIRSIMAPVNVKKAAETGGFF
jgi:hypothetical protein